MGLGPAICNDCKVFACYEPHPTDEGRQGTWYCPVCNKKDNDLGNLWNLPISEQDSIKTVKPRFTDV